jgi:hypothetical protein
MDAALQKRRREEHTAALSGGPGSGGGAAGPVSPRGGGRGSSSGGAAAAVAAAMGSLSLGRAGSADLRSPAASSSYSTDYTTSAVRGAPGGRGLGLLWQLGRR